MQTRTPTNQKKNSAAQLPAPAPGKVISIPLSLWLEYLRIHHLKVVGKKDTVILTLPIQQENKS